MNAPARKSARSRWLAGLAVLALALTLSLMLLLSDGGCTPAVAFDRTIAEEAPKRRPLELDSGVTTRTSSPAVATEEGTQRRRDPVLAPASSVSGIVTDVVTHEIVPYVEVELVLANRSERIAVGDDGAFASTTGFPSGELRAIVRDDVIEVGRASIAHGAERGTRGWRVEVPIGPTIHIATIDGLYYDPANWRARIRESALEEDVVGELDVGAEGLSLYAPSPALPDRAWSWARVRSGGWARYARQEHPPIAGVRPRVQVRNDAENSDGRARLKSTIGAQPTLAVTTTRFGRIAVDIARTKDAKPMRAVLFDLRDSTTSTAVGPPTFEELDVTSEGYVEFADLEPGRKQLIAWSQDELFEDRYVASRGSRLEAKLSPRKSRRTGSGALPRSTGDVPYGWSGASERLIASPSDASSRMRSWIQPIEDFDSSTSDFLRRSTSDIRFRSSASVLEPSHDFVQTKSVRHAIRMTLGLGGPSIAGRISFGPGGVLFPSKSHPADEPFELPESIYFTWSAWAEGMQPVFGTQREFVEQSDGTRVASVAVQRGSGFELLLRAGDPARIAQDPWPWPANAGGQDLAVLAALAAAPVPGVKVEIDTYAAGASDLDGSVRVSHPILPRRITLVGRGWRLCALDRLPGGEQRYVAWLRRNP